MGRRWRQELDLLLHDLQVDLGHVNFLAELWREFGALEELRIHSCRHDGQTAGYAASTAMCSGEQKGSCDVGVQFYCKKGGGRWVGSRSSSASGQFQWSFRLGPGSAPLHNDDIFWGTYIYIYIYIFIS